MGIFGSKAKLLPQSAGFAQLQGEVNKLSAVGGARDQLGGLRQAFLRDIAGGRKSDLRALQQAKQADIAQAASAGGPTTTLESATDRAIARAQGLSKVTSGTATAFNQQLLRDRIGVTRQERQRTGEGLKAITGSAQLETTLDRARKGTADVKSQIRQEQFGTGFGAAAAAASDFDFSFGRGDDLIEKPGKVQAFPPSP